MTLWTGIVTEHVNASRDFYTRLFGADVVYEGEGAWFVLLRLGERELAFMRPGLDTQAPIFQGAYGGQGMWLALDVDDAEAEHRRLVALGAPVVLPLRDEPWGDRHFVLRDPNGIGVDIVQRLAA
ncbi:VOC family protein [Hydrogenophaga crocea]|jgi:catechol 2,3-dioxygenase-like lactoylglutathione lyase family enzyme|uniref:Glyoxalase/bleomycin resistance/extradiol dioxygenase family protein n=1 Tax=Hydrogenophaga crocea TaxID=2716225 RepID=A0A6G8II13_9BURK|nr:VOC family protein [Hydrogenophaga crocea]QIM52600.1 glyoxalase/bleomycin resistance/extradiol dioxygenase family protein [Hydrogenophaga crocea]